MKFLKKHKKLFIILGVILAILITLIVLMFTLFSLKEVEIEFETGNNNLTTEIQQQITQEIDLGGTVFFKDKTEMINRIESKYPYAKVINIETILPNKFVIHLAERQETYAISSLNKTCVLDSELKILKMEDASYISTNSNAVYINLFDLEFNMSSFKEGQFLNLQELTISNASLGKQSQETLNEILNCFHINNRSLMDLKAFAKEINFETYTDYRTGEIALKARIVDFNDFEIAILCPTEHLENKISNMLYAYEKVVTENPEKLNTHKMTVYTNSKGEDLVIIEQKAWICIANFALLSYDNNIWINIIKSLA